MTQMSTKHKEVEPDWNDKNVMQTARPHIPWKVLPMARITILKIFKSSAKKI